MSKLLKNGQFIQNDWLDLNTPDVPTTAKTQKYLVPLATWLLDIDQNRQQACAGLLGVSLSAEDDPSKLTQEDFAVLGLITVNFPRFTDGRGYSTATLLRRAGYQAELRAVGDILVDQLHFLRRVGFDAFALRDDQSEQDAIRLLTVFSQAYQTSSDTAQPLYRRVQRG